MEFWLRDWSLYQISIAGLGFLVVVFIVSLVSIKNQTPIEIKRVEENKLLLKSLLEGFGLELPPELKQPEEVIGKPKKAN